MIWRRTFSRGYYQNEALKLILTDLGERSDENELSVFIRRPQCTVWYDWSRHFDHSSGKPGRPVRLCYIGLEHTSAAESCMLVLELTRVTWQLLRAHTPHRERPRTPFVVFIKATVWPRPQTARWQVPQLRRWHTVIRPCWAKWCYSR